MKFSQVFWASFLGMMATFIFGFIVIFLTFIFIISSISDSIDSWDKKTPVAKIKQGDILKISIQGALERFTPSLYIYNIPLEEQNYNSVEKIKEAIDQAVNDPKIAGIWLDVGPIYSSWSYIEELTAALDHFASKSNKKIISSSNFSGFNEQSYYLMTAANNIYAYPNVSIEFDGFYISSKFYKKMFDKIGIGYDVFRHGDYKGAVEPYIRSSFSEENSEQLKDYMEIISTSFIERVAQKRNRSKEDVNDILNLLPPKNAYFALENNLVDSLATEKKIEDIWKKTHLTSISSSFISVENYLEVTKNHNSNQTDYIVVIPLSGAILPSEIEIPWFLKSQTISYKQVYNSLNYAIKNKHVKGIILYIDSPGGSLDESERIYKLLKEKGSIKPIWAYFGSVTASGGYYISLGASKLIAQPSTLTGSIGVYIIRPYVSELLEKNIGITHGVIKTHPYADTYSNMARSLTEKEKTGFQRIIDKGYNRFLSRVAKNRNMPMKTVNTYARGRIWSGKHALKLNLIDELATLEEAAEQMIEYIGSSSKLGIKLYHPKKQWTEVLFQNIHITIESYVKGYTPLFLHTKYMAGKSYLIWEFLLSDHSPQILALLPFDISVK